MTLDIFTSLEIWAMFNMNIQHCCIDIKYIKDEHIGAVKKLAYVYLVGVGVFVLVGVWRTRAEWTDCVLRDKENI